MILCVKYVNSIFRNCKAYDFTKGKAFFSLDENLLESLFPEEYKIAKYRAENEYKEVNKNV